jgi:hypothetical protein
MMRSLVLLLLALTPLGTLSLRVSTDASCGGSKGSTCLGSAFGQCCSQVSAFRPHCNEYRLAANSNT